ncbi:MAG: alpha-L-fucosidase [Bacteroidota bacterium]
MKTKEIISKTAIIYSETAAWTAILLLFLTFCPSLVIAQDGLKAPQRPDNFQPYIYEKSTQQLKKDTKEHLKRAAQEMADMEKVIYDGPYKATFASLSNHHTPEWYQDAKFGIALNYGLYSLVGYGAQGYGGNYYTDTYLDHIYKESTKGEYYTKHWGEDFEKDDFIQYFNAEEINADKFIKLFKSSGAKYFVQFNMHRSTGMLLWNSSFTYRDAIDMNPHRDLAGEFVEACRKYDLPYGFYLNLEDSYYPLLNENGQIQVREWTFLDENQRAINGSFETTHPYNPDTYARRLQGKVPVYDYIDDYLLPASKEFIDKYEPDYLWFDGGWKRPAWYYKTHEIVAYYYNKFEGKKDVMINARMGKDLYGKLGDVITSEGGQVDDYETLNTWEEIRPFGKNFAYDWREHDGNIISSSDLIHMFIRIVAQGGNLLLVVAPDGKGVIPDYQLTRLDDMGKWLETNGEAIYQTRQTPWVFEESILGKNVYYTQSKDEKYTYAICLKLDDAELILSKVKAKQGSEIKLLGYDEPLFWRNLPWGLTIQVPEEMQDVSNLPGGFAWVFKFESIGDNAKKPSIQAE